MSDTVSHRLWQDGSLGVYSRCLLEGGHSHYKVAPRTPRQHDMAAFFGQAFNHPDGSRVVVKRIFLASPVCAPNPPRTSLT